MRLTRHYHEGDGLCAQPTTYIYYHAGSEGFCARPAALIRG